jgi:hypothetical protein
LNNKAGFNFRAMFTSSLVQIFASIHNFRD